MARRPLGLVAAVLAAGALAGCGSTSEVTVSAPTSATSSSPASSSSSTTSASSAAASSPLSDSDQVPDPTLGECLNNTGSKWSAVDCGKSHDVEVSAIVPSKWDKRDLVARAALRTWTCDHTAAAYLGGPANATFLAAIPMPAATDPRSDERIVCLAYRFDTGNEGSVVRTTGPMRGSLADPKQLAKRRVCLDRVTTDTAVPKRLLCSQKHASEAVTEVSLGNATAPYPGDAKIRALAKRLCGPKVKSYLGGVTRKDLVAGARGSGVEQWRAGHRAATCFVSVKGAKLTKSVKGIKHRPLKEFR